MNETHVRILMNYASAIHTSFCRGNYVKRAMAIRVTRAAVHYVPDRVYVVCMRVETNT